MDRSRLPLGDGFSVRRRLETDSVPENWIVNDPINEAFFEQMELTEAGMVVEGWGGRRLVDTSTLELQLDSR